MASREFIEKVKARVLVDLKDHTLEEEVDNGTIKSYKFRKPQDSFYWMRIIETPYGIHLEGDIGVMQVDRKDMYWMAHSNSYDYMLSKLDQDIHKQDTISEYKVKNLASDMLSYARENRRDKRDNYEHEHFIAHPNQVRIFSEDEREFFATLKADNYKPEWSLEEFYRQLQNLGEFWAWTYDDGLNIIDYSWHTYFQFFCLQYAAQKIIEFRDAKSKI